MAIHHHRVGDVVILRDGFTKTDVANRTCTIVGILPATERGDAQYRVRFGAERCERRVVQADIETTSVHEAANTSDEGPIATGSPWLKPMSLRKTR